MEIAIVYIILCVCVGWYASTKGKGAVGYFFLSVFLSPLIGFIIAALVNKDIKKVENKAISAGTQKKCPFCAEMIKPEAVVCRYCNRDIPVESRPLSGRQVECAGCKNYVPVEAATAIHGEFYCPLCAQKKDPSQA